MLALRRLAPVAARATTRTSIRAFSGEAEVLKSPPSKAEEAKYSKVIKIGDKLFGIPAAPDDSIATDLQQQTGRRFEEAVYELTGEALFSRDPIFALPNQGTKANPVLVPSGEDHRMVGFEDPHSHQLSWFKLKADQLTYVPRIDKYFKLQKV